MRQASMSDSDLSALTVRAEWDSEAGVWVAESDDVPGLVTEADTLERLVERLPRVCGLRAHGGGCGARLWLILLGFLVWAVSRGSKICGHTI